MSRDRGYLLDILESAKITLSHLGDKSQSEFADDIKCQDAVIRRLEINWRSGTSNFTNESR